MKTVIIYYSKTGFTKRYADWLNEEIQGDIYSYKEVKQIDLSKYDIIIFGSHIMAGKIGNVEWFKEIVKKDCSKQYVLFYVGASEKVDEKVLKDNFSEDELKEIQAYYLPGGLNYQKMSFMNKLMMKMVVKMMKSQDEEGANRMSCSYDLSDKKYLAKMIQEIELK